MRKTANLKVKAYEHIEHGFEPVYDKRSTILILGTMPSVKSRETDFYYGHPQNRFWKVIAQVTGEKVPITIREKKALLLRNGIAIWDVIKECDIVGSDDSSIKNVVPADIKGILDMTGIKNVYGNGAKACELYEKFILQDTKIPIIKLPSTSPANAAYSLEKLVDIWREKLGK